MLSILYAGYVIEGESGLLSGRVTVGLIITDLVLIEITDQSSAG